MGHGSGSSAGSEGSHAGTQLRGSQQQHQQGEGHGHVSFAFGSMSLDDLNALASMSSSGAGGDHGAPYFSSSALMGMAHARDPDATPMGALRRGGGDAGGASREMEMKDLKDFWKAYVRT